MTKQYDVVIIGTGVAGLYGALHYNDNTKILIITKKDAPLSNSSLAQGGIAAVLDRSNDDPKLHKEDTLIAGKYINNPEAIDVLVNEGPQDVLNLRRLGVEFDCDENGKMLSTLEAGHSRHRIVHHKDFTGKAVTDKLIELVQQKKNIEFCEHTLVFNIEKAEKGFFVEILKDGEISQVGCKYCVLATGGIGRVYKYTTNSAIATGDGIAFAKKMGARIKNLHRIQFHPTAFAAEHNRERFLISEAVRGEGAVLLNCDGRRFAFDYDVRGELAPRDVVSNAIMLEYAKTKSENFYLDITDKPSDFLKARFPMIYENCLAEGVDITKDRIPVFPCQHYLMGGIDVDLYGRTTVPRLYAAGECSHTGVHGANRLASNSLLEALVWSRRIAQDITNKLNGESDYSIGIAPQLTDGKGEKMPTGIRTEIRSILQDTYFVIPRPEKYAQSLKRLKEIDDMLENNSYELTSDWIEAKSLATVALTIMEEVTQKDEKEI